jgi:hypothetical protein
MKSLILIPLATLAFFAIVTALLLACRVRINAIDPLAAGAISAGAGTLGIFPIAVSKRKDPVGIFQLALVGTVLHMFAAVALTVTAMAAHLVAPRLGFMSWLLAGYWLSLILLIWQLRHRLIAAIDPPKGPATI